MSDAAARQDALDMDAAGLTRQWIGGNDDQRAAVLDYFADQAAADAERALALLAAVMFELPGRADSSDADLADGLAQAWLAREAAAS